MTRSLVRRLLPCGAVLSLLCSTQGVAQVVPTPPGEREINVTTDSAPGWLPSVALEQAARQAADRYLSAVDAAAWRRAYDLMHPDNQATEPFAQFTQLGQAFHDQAGALRQRRVLKITWTKDPAEAPHPGIYAAIDIAATFERVDRHCGYIILYQAPVGGAFTVMRSESNYIDNATAARIEHDQSRDALDRLWASLSQNCPNFATLAAH